MWLRKLSDRMMSQSHTLYITLLFKHPMCPWRKLSTTIDRWNIKQIPESGKKSSIWQLSYIPQDRLRNLLGTSVNPTESTYTSVLSWNKAGERPTTKNSIQFTMWQLKKESVWLTEESIWCFKNITKGVLGPVIPWSETCSVVVSTTWLPSSTYWRRCGNCCTSFLTDSMQKSWYGVIHKCGLCFMLFMLYVIRVGVGN